MTAGLADEVHLTSSWVWPMEGGATVAKWGQWWHHHRVTTDGTKYTESAQGGAGYQGVSVNILSSGWHSMAPGHSWAPSLAPGLVNSQTLEEASITSLSFISYLCEPAVNLNQSNWQGGAVPRAPRPQVHCPWPLHPCTELRAPGASTEPLGAGDCCL